jgi:hypothetical protein
MLGGRQTNQQAAEEKVEEEKSEVETETTIPNYVSYPYLRNELDKWARKNDFNLSRCDAVEETILLTLGVNLTATPSLFCIFREATYDSERFEFSAFFTNEHMETLGGLHVLQQNVFNKLIEISADLDPQQGDSHHSKLETYGYDLNQIKVMTINVKVKPMLTHLLPAMQEKLRQTPALVAHYQRFNYSTARVLTQFKLQAELALTDYQFEDRIQQLANIATNGTPGSKLKMLTDEAMSTTNSSSLSADDLAERLRSRLINRDITPDSDAFQDLLAEQNLSPAIDLMTAKDNELFAIVGLAILLQIRENLQTHSILIGVTDTIPSFPTVLNPLIFEYLNLPTPTTEPLLLQDDDAITFQLESKKRHSYTHQPITRFNVPTSIADKVMELFNQHETGSAKIVAKENQVVEEIKEEASEIIQESFIPPVKKPTSLIVVENKSLLNPSFLSDIRGMLPLFKAKAFTHHRLPLDAVCSRFYLIGQRYGTSQQIIEDFYTYSVSGRDLVNKLYTAIDKLETLSTKKSTKPLVWHYLQSIRRYYQEVLREETELSFRNQKPEVAHDADAARQRIQSYLKRLECPLADMEKQFTIKTIEKLPGAFQEIIHYMLMLREKILKCPIYQLSCSNGLRSELDETIDALENMLFYYISKSAPDEHDYIDDRTEETYMNTLARHASIMGYITDKLETVLVEQSKLITSHTKQDSDFFNDPDVYVKMKRWSSLFNKTCHLAVKIEQINSRLFGLQDRYDYRVINQNEIGNALEQLFEEQEEPTPVAHMSP